MITCFYIDGKNISSVSINHEEKIPAGTIWVDMVSPSLEEENCIKSQIGVNIPSREEIWKNQVLNRLYREKDVTYMIAAIITKMNSPYPEISPVTFILTKNCLVTIRTILPTSFFNFSQRIVKEAKDFPTANAVLEGLLEEILTRVAHNSEVVTGKIDELSHYIFDWESAGKPGQSQAKEMKSVLRRLGSAADLNSKINESVHSIIRLLNFFAEEPENSREVKTGISALITDANVLIQQTSFLSDKVTFQLDATLGMINVEQNIIIKIFSVVATFFLPPTLVSSIYGMNFHHMPELEWISGYPMAVLIMLLTAILPYLYFRKKGWL